jgi:hypothetical protein
MKALIDRSTASRLRVSATGVPASLATRSRRRLCGALFALASLAPRSAALAQSGGGRPHWVASWATSPAAYFVYAAPVPQNQALGFATTKSVVANMQPDLWGRTMRVRLSNVWAMWR